MTGTSSSQNMDRTCERCGRVGDDFPRVGNPNLGTSSRWCAECWSIKTGGRSPHPSACRRGHPLAARATNGRRTWCWACAVEREVAM